ncbi:hypothetical protein NOL39_18700 [Acinetobacter baumannii]|uniref:hypothetical protein n=1 Tax=Acinetobacter baumannii TaxID=470 RepID=UPI002FBDA653
MKKLMLTLLGLFCGVAHAECKTGNVYYDIECFEKQLKTALLHKDLKVKTSHIYSNLSDNSGMWSA